MKHFAHRFFIAIIASGLLLMAGGCASRRIVTAWKTEHVSPVNHSRLLVVAILPDQDSLERKKIEAGFTATLQGLGYQAVSAIDEFGMKGLANQGEAETYTRLCSKGIDAVVTVALVNHTKETSRTPVTARVYPSNFYYRRIWEYKNTLTQPDRPGITTDEYVWESILFDLSTLEALCVVQNQSSTREKQLKQDEDLARLMLRRMMKERILKKQVKSPKAF